MKASLVSILACAALCGCGLARRAEYQEHYRAASAAVESAVSNCNQQYSQENVKLAVARASCLNAATLPLRPYMPFSDLFDLDNANRLATAEKIQNGTLSRAQATQEYLLLHSQLVAEEERRTLASRSVGAQETAAAAQMRASMPVSCTRYGPTVTCY